MGPCISFWCYCGCATRKTNKTVIENFFKVVGEPVTENL